MKVSDYIFRFVAEQGVGHVFVVVGGGAMYLNEALGIGVDIDEKVAAKYPFQQFPAGTGFRFPIRKADGTQIRP